MGLLSGMEMFGLGNFENADILEDLRPENKIAGELKRKEEKKEPPFNEEDVLFDKHYTCPVCDHRFISRSVRAGKVRLVAQDDDLRPIYDKVDVLKYDAVVCDNCGYAALIRYFGKVSVKQSKEIQSAVSDNFKGINNNKGIYTYDDAIARYKLALITAVVKRAKASEKGYICLKLAWLTRGKSKEGEVPATIKQKLQKEELEYINNAYATFTVAISNEPFPIAGMDENTLKYILANMAFRIKKYDECTKLLSFVITSRSANERLKEKARKLKDKIKVSKQML